MAPDPPSAGPRVGPADVRASAGAVTAVLHPLRDADWGVPAGALEWDCRSTLEHLIDTLLLYTVHLATRAERPLPYPRQGDPSAPVRHLLRTMSGCASILAEVATTAGPDARAWHPAGTSDPAGFCAMACDEILVHGEDIALGLATAVVPPPGTAGRVLARLFPERTPGVDPWAALRRANGRPAPGGEPRGPGWTWHSAPIDAG